MQRDNRLRIMMVYGFPSNPYVEYVVRSLIKRGIRIFLMTRKDLKLTLNNKTCSVYKIFPGSRYENYFLLSSVLECISLIKLVRLLILTKPDIIHFQSFRIAKVDWLFFLLLKIIRQKVVFTIHDTHSHSKLLPLLDNFIMVNVSRHCDALFVHTRYSKHLIKESWKIQERKIFVVPHGAYYLHYGTCISRESARKELGYQKSDYVLLFFGSIRKYKGLDYLIPAVKSVRKVIPNLKLIIAGKPINQHTGEYYGQLIFNLNLENEINYQDRFINNEEIAGLFCCCDIVVLPYTQIDQSGVLCLSYTFGKPVIATQVGGLAEMIREGVTGYTVPRANIHKLSEKIIEAWENRLNFAEMGLKAKKLIDEEYSWDRLAKSTIEVYQKILNV
jgi:glycosyltransferase involved in cell wall biosynthesis